MQFYHFACFSPSHCSCPAISSGKTRTHNVKVIHIQVGPSGRKTQPFSMLFEPLYASSTPRRSGAGARAIRRCRAPAGDCAVPAIRHRINPRRDDSARLTSHHFPDRRTFRREPLVAGWLMGAIIVDSMRSFSFCPGAANLFDVTVTAFFFLPLHRVFCFRTIEWHLICFCTSEFSTKWVSRLALRDNERACGRRAVECCLLESAMVTTVRARHYATNRSVAWSDSSRLHRRETRLYGLAVVTATAANCVDVDALISLPSN